MFSLFPFLVEAGQARLASHRQRIHSTDDMFSTRVRVPSAFAFHAKPCSKVIQAIKVPNPHKTTHTNEHNSIDVAYEQKVSLLTLQLLLHKLNTSPESAKGTRNTLQGTLAVMMVPRSHNQQKEMTTFSIVFRVEKIKTPAATFL
jgi:hypothetical protein